MCRSDEQRRQPGIELARGVVVLAASVSVLDQSSNVEGLAGVLDAVVDRSDEANSGAELFTQLAGTL